MPRTSSVNRRSRSPQWAPHPKTKRGLNERQKQAFDRRKRRAERNLRNEARRWAR